VDSIGPGKHLATLRRSCRHERVWMNGVLAKLGGNEGDCKAPIHYFMTGRTSTAQLPALPILESRLPEKMTSAVQVEKPGPLNLCRGLRICPCRADGAVGVFVWYFLFSPFLFRRESVRVRRPKPSRAHDCVRTPG